MDRSVQQRVGQALEKYKATEFVKASLEQQLLKEENQDLLLKIEDLATKKDLITQEDIDGIVGSRDKQYGKAYNQVNYDHPDEPERRQALPKDPFQRDDDSTPFSYDKNQNNNPVKDSVVDANLEAKERDAKKREEILNKGKERANEELELNKDLSRNKFKK